MSELVAYAVPAFFLLIGIELLAYRWWPKAGARGYTTRDAITSLSLGVANVAVAAAVKAPLAVLVFAVYEHRIFDIGQSAVAWCALFLAEDFCYYWFHRTHHEVRALWAAHVNHHSSRFYNLTTALRQSITTPITGPVFWLPLAIIGFHPLMVLTMQAISLLYQFWLHTEHIGRLGPLERVFNTPSHHRVHHGRNVAYLDRNYGGILIVWDRLFGTFEPEGEAVDYGLTKNLTREGVVHAAVHEWVAIARDVARASGWRERFALLLQPPGWSADGRTRTAREMQAAAVRAG